MEKVDLEAQEASNFVDPNMIGIDSNSMNQYHIDIRESEDNVVLRVDPEGAVIYWDREGFIKLCETSEDPTLKAMLAIYNLGIIDGMKN